MVLVVVAVAVTGAAEDFNVVDVEVVAVVVDSFSVDAAMAEVTEFREEEVEGVYSDDGKVHQLERLIQGLVEASLFEIATESSTGRATILTMPTHPSDSYPMFHRPATGR